MLPLLHDEVCKFAAASILRDLTIMAIIRGTNANDDPLNGSDLSDGMNGFNGDDRMFGFGGNDNMHGDGGNDKLHGGLGNDSLDGGLDGSPLDDKFAADADLLDGGEGIDTATYSQVQHGVSVNLLQGITLGQGNVDALVSIENVTGTNFNDSLIGDGGNNGLQGADGIDFLDGGAGNDNLNGGIGNDTLKGNIGDDILVGSSGADKLDGGGGADLFRYFLASDSGIGAGKRDVIADFQHGVDKIDLHFIDAKAGSSGNQDFIFKASNDFSADGQVRVITEGDHTLVQLNTIGTGVAEAEIELSGHINLSASDFLL
jgi:Ca2+-binding RTX toxin-like protein